MTLEEIQTNWKFKNDNKQASVDMWDSMAESFGEQPIPSVESSSFLQLLQRSYMFNRDSIVLDVGCGTGIYSLALAKYCKKVIGIDLSPKMIKIAERKALDEQIQNVEFHCLDWKEFDIGPSGYEKQFDLVFAHMTPAVQSADTFLKLLTASRGWCALSKPTRRTDPVSDKVKELIGIQERRESSDQDILYAFELLWQQGINPHLEYEKTQWDMRKTLEEAYGLYINRMKTYRNLTIAEEQRAKQYLQSLARDGAICEKVDTTITTMYWHV